MEKNNQMQSVYSRSKKQKKDSDFLRSDPHTEFNSATKEEG